MDRIHSCRAFGQGQSNFILSVERELLPKSEQGDLLDFLDHPKPLEHLNPIISSLKAVALNLPDTVTLQCSSSVVVTPKQNDFSAIS